MNATKKMQLSVLKVNSFVTAIDKDLENTVKAGATYTTTKNYSGRTCVVEEVAATQKPTSYYCTRTTFELVARTTTQTMQSYNCTGGTTC